MKRTFNVVALALALAGGVYMAADTAVASNMGFKLERSFTYSNSARPLYYVSFPLFNGVADVCNRTTASTVCSSLTGAVGDGEITPCDALCDMWTDLPIMDPARRKVFTMQRIDPETCLFVPITVDYSVLGNTVLGGGDLLVDVRDQGWKVEIDQAGQESDNRAVIVGSHDRRLRSAPRPLPAASRCGMAG